MAKKNFEEALKDLEEITRDLEEGDLGLEESLKKFNQGIKLADFCSRKLDDAEKQVEILLEKNGVLRSEPFDNEERS